MKANDIQPGSTYVGRGGTERRTVLEIVPGVEGGFRRRDRRRVRYLGPRGEEEVQLHTFTYWAVCRVET